MTNPTKLHLPVCLAVAAVLSGCRTPRSEPVVQPTMPAPRVFAATERLIPAPVSMTVTGGEAFVVSDSTVIVVDADHPEVMAMAEWMAGILRPSTGFAIPVVRGAAVGTAPRTIVLRLRPDGAANSEAYRLDASAARGVEIVAATPVGVFRGLQTLRQLFPAGIEHHMKWGNGPWPVPAVTITDQPRFAWRGAMLDVSRHFFTVREVKQYIDILALYKMNILHLHLADDQGWRIEIKSRPQLVAQGSVTQVAGGPGGFFTQDDYTDIVRYAAQRYITVVPEIDMPGHTNAALISHPHLSCGKHPPAPYTGTEVGFSALCPDKEETYALVDDIVRELSAITPGPWFHMGGDEVETLTPPQYAAFVERVSGIVARHGKQLVGWEEVNKARLPAGSLVQQWRGDPVTPQAGARLIMSPGRRLYLDMKYNDATELGLKWGGLIEVRTVYDWDPAQYNPGVPESSVAGVEAPVWAETVRNIGAVQYLAMPRLPAVAELGWTPQSGKDWESFRVRLASQASRWHYLGINYYRSSQIPWP